MSDQEEEVMMSIPKITNPKDSYDPDIDGACGGGEPFRSLSPGSNSVDNLSMEVQFEEESSRHPSEISSLSYQNLLEDGEGSGHILSRHESEDSNDSFPPDYSDNYSSENVGRGQTLSDLPTEINVKYREKFSMGTTERTGDLKLGNNFKVGERNEIVMNKMPIIDSHDMMEEIDLESKDIVSMHTFDVDEIPQRERVKKRNSLEIRNNIPVVGEIKSYDKDLDPHTYSSQGAKPKIRKQSPGLACRVGDGSGGSGSDREGSSSDRELERPVKKPNLQPLGNALNPHSNTCPVHTSDDKIKNMDLMNVVVNPASSIRSAVEEMSNGSGGQTGPGPDVENEYDYVKYSRIQDGDSYVGMRLAYSSTDEGMKRNSLEVNGFSNNSIIDISREGSPEKSLVLHKLDFSAPNVPQKVNEDTLTEIPLNTVESIHGEDKQAFSLSPETTECDSVEVESVTSDGDKSNLGMPLVEDGLSSSQASDNEDYVPPSNQVPKSPTAMLRKKQKSDIEQEMLTTPKEDSKHKQLDAEAIMEDLKAKREALDLAIHDIKSAIQNSKGISLKSPFKENNQEEEPIWVMREGANTETKPSSQRHEGVGSSPCTEYNRKEQDNVYQMDNEKDCLLENQYTRNEGKSYQPPRGYDSDEEEDGDVKYTRRILGKKYASLPKDDSFDQHPTHKLPSQNGSNPDLSVHGNDRNSRCSSDSYSYKKSYRVSAGSLGSDSEDVGSETEAPSRASYLKTKTAGDFDTDEETDILLQKQYQKDQYVDIPELSQPPVNRSAQAEKRRSRAKEVSLRDPDNHKVLIEGVLFRAKYLGSTQLISEGQPSKALRMMQAQEAVGRIKAPEGENQPSTAVDLFVSTEKIMVLNTDLQEIMMDHSLRTISYIADIGDILVIMARRRLLSSPGEEILHQKKQAKILCHVFESDEAQLIAQSIGQAFQVAYMEFLKANGIEDAGLMKEIDYQDVLNQQEIYGEELNLFSNKEKHKEVIVPKLKSEVLGIVIVESGWGSMVPTVVLANMAPTGPAARCGQLNIGDQIISINGISLVGLPLSACQNYIKSAKNQTVVKLTVVPCPPVVEVLIKRPDVKYQLGFSVQNGVICSLLRGGIAERGGVRVGHRIIEINNQSVVAVPHEKIVSLLANSVGEIHMRTMPTSIFRLLTGQETPHYL
ncbi:Protein lin-10 [Mizuhopecten yessoensis]|uniref:Protein lin-10 n=1 Tax=Mizuhopecten yessoensis TaxID=6573 RepID=A0A210QBW1_MIZYE|nr:Protein lin-10 [Mizuhopecten yessoensis]